MGFSQRKCHRSDGTARSVQHRCLQTQVKKKKGRGFTWAETPTSHSQAGCVPVNICLRVGGGQKIPLCLCEHKDYDLSHTLNPPPPHPPAAQSCSWQSDPYVHCSDMKTPLSPPEYMNYELWRSVKAPSQAEACSLSNPPPPFTGSDGEIGGPLSPGPKWLPEM